MSRFLKYASRSFRIWTSFPTTMARTQETDASTRLGGAQHLHAAGTNRGSRRVARPHRRVAPHALERVVEAGVLMEQTKLRHASFLDDPNRPLATLCRVYLFLR